MIKEQQTISAGISEVRHRFEGGGGAMLARLSDVLSSQSTGESERKRGVADPVSGGILWIRRSSFECDLIRRTRGR